MTGKLFGFFPYSRRGAAAQIMNKEPQARGSAATIVTLWKQPKGGPELQLEPPKSHDFAVLGPGDVIGFDISEIVRTSPVPGSDNDSANYLAHIEFAHPDLPWLFTPFAPANDRLTPWINLIVLERGQNAPRIKPGSPNPRITVSVRDLPNLDDSWAWAHVQVAVSKPDEDVSSILATGHSPSTVSRLLCPRRLDPHKDYVACVVPTFELGRKAGLGLKPEEDEITRAPGRFAWMQGGADRSATLPVFHHWYFRTGPAGDFETLAQRLFGIHLENTKAGKRTVLVGPTTSRFPDDSNFAGRVIDFRTAITADKTEGLFSPNSPGGAPDRAAVHRSLKRLINLRREKDESDGKMRHVVGPPLYGRWHAQVKDLDPDGAPARGSGWIEEVNLDPEMRAAAALGARVVQQNQEALMADAWQQLKAVDEANRRARWGQVFMTASIKMHEMRVAGRPPTDVLRLANSSLGRLRQHDVTVAATLTKTALPQIAVSANFARSARYAVKALQRGGLHEPAAPLQVMASVVPTMLLGGRVFEQRFKPPTYLPPQQFKNLFAELTVNGASFDHAVEQIDAVPSIIDTMRGRIRVEPELPARIRPAVIEEAPAQLGPDHVIIQVHDRAGFIVGNGIDPGVIQNRITVNPTQFDAVAAAALAPHAAAPRRLRVIHWAGGVPQAVALERSAIPQLIEENPGVGPLDAQQFVVSQSVRERFDRFADVLTLDAPIARSFSDYASVRSALHKKLNPALDFSASPIVVELGAEAKDIFARMPARLTLADQRHDFPDLVTLEPDAIKRVVVDLLEPVRHYEAMLKWALPMGTGNEIGQARRRSPAHQIMFAPRFSEAMFGQLKRLDRNWIIGHADELPLNSISIFGTNPKFVEALLVGANYEMARELQWRRYPTDLMGTCFTKFWSSTIDDIAPIHLWDKPLGRNSPAARGNAGEDVVVVIRGDLLRLYPNTDVTAVLGRIEDGRLVTMESKPAFFRQAVEPDIALAGFALHRDWPSAPPGSSWYIALTQPADEAKFGLDEVELGRRAEAPPSGRSNMSWQNMVPQIWEKHLVAGMPVAGPQADGWAGLAGEKLKWGPESDSGQIAALLYQNRFQVLLKASDYIK